MSKGHLFWSPNVKSPIGIALLYGCQISSKQTENVLEMTKMQFRRVYDSQGIGFPPCAWKNTFALAYYMP